MPLTRQQTVKSVVFCVNFGGCFNLTVITHFLYVLHTEGQLVLTRVLCCGRVVMQYQELVQSEAKCPVRMSHSSSGSAGPSQPSPGTETGVGAPAPLCRTFPSPAFLAPPRPCLCSGGGPWGGGAAVGCLPHPP